MVRHIANFAGDSRLDVLMCSVDGLKGLTYVKFGCCVGLEQLPQVVSSGFDYAELRVGETVPLESDSEWALVRDRIADTKVPIGGFNVLLPSDMKVVGPDVDEGALDHYLEIAFSRMNQLGGQHLSFGSGGARRIPDGFDRQQAVQQLQHFIGYLGQLGKRHDITIDIEFLNSKETNVIVSLLEAQGYAKATALPNVKLLADLYHLMEEQEPLTDLYKVADDLGYVHVADSNRLFPGSGAYPFKQLSQILREINYTGPISVECRWNDMISEMPRVAAYLREVFA